MIEQILVPESLLRNTEPEVAKLVSAMDPRVIIDSSHPIYGPAFLHYMLFNSWSFLLGDAQPASEELRFYNEYYWYCKFAKSYCDLNGRDVGLEQQGFQLLETANGEIDWGIVEQIHALFPYDRKME